MSNNSSKPTLFAASTLVPCPDCGSTVSHRATSCPACGRLLVDRRWKRLSLRGLAVSAAGILVMIMVASSLGRWWERWWGDG
jgi:uncharacterized paraquat-inducible protein A